MNSLQPDDPTTSPVYLAAVTQARFPAHSPGTNFTAGALQLAGARIRNVTPDPHGSDGPQLNGSDCLLLPGFIDLHIHGGGGRDTMDATPAALRAISRFVARHGVTAFTPTTMTAPHAPTLNAVRNVAAVTADTMPGAAILGVHLEGPYISPRFPGAQAKEDIRPANGDELAQLLDAGPVRAITLAPEEPGVDALIQQALAAGVRVIIGHSAATYAQTIAAFDRGVSQATHTFNAMTGLHHRNPGVVGAVLSDDRVFAQLIADTIHVHPAVMNILARCKGPERLLLITDAIRATGLGEGESELGGQVVTVRDGRCVLADGTLAGSILTMDAALRNLLAATGWSLETAWPVTSRTPAAALGIDDEYGSIAPGYRADLTLLDDGLEVVGTVVGGRLVYLRAGEEWRLRD